MGKYRKIIVGSAAVAVVGLAISGAGCGMNIFSPFDAPSGDAQILSRARACFDRGDLTCARTYYARLSTDANDTKNSELAFAILHENGATMGAFLNAFGTASSGKAFSNLAAYMKTNAGETKRLAVYEAYALVASIANDRLRGLVRFVTASALAAEILAEDIAIDGNAATHAANDLVQDSTTCATFNAATCSGEASCGAATGAALQTGAGAVDLDTGSSTVTGTQPTLRMFHSAIQKVLLGLGSTELNASSSLSTPISTISTALDAAATAFLPATPECYLNALVLQGVGG